MKKAARTKRSVASAHVPDHGSRNDPALQRFGIPDTMVLVAGVKLWAHYEILSQHSGKLREELHTRNLDEHWGRTLVIRPGPSAPRSVQGVKAWLRAIYPPQGLPSPELMQEVESLAREFRMEALLHHMKLGVAASFDLRDVAAHEQQALERGAFGCPVAPVVLEALSEFSISELKEMPGYADLSLSVKLEVARQRVALLEKIFEHDRADSEPHKRAGAKPKVVRACVRAHPELFRACPDDLRMDTVRLDAGFLYEEEESQFSPSTKPSVTGSAYSTFSGEETRPASVDRTRMPSYSATSASQARWHRTFSGTHATGARLSAS